MSPPSWVSRTGAQRHRVFTHSLAVSRIHRLEHTVTLWRRNRIERAARLAPRSGVTTGDQKCCDYKCCAVSHWLSLWVTAQGKRFKTAPEWDGEIRAHNVFLSSPIDYGEETRANYTTYDRRSFMSYFASIGLGSTLFPGVLWARVASGEEITVATIASAEEVAGLKFDEAERAMMLEGLKAQEQRLEALHKIPLANGVAPAIVFNPVPPGERRRALRRRRWCARLLLRARYRQISKSSRSFR